MSRGHRGPPRGASKPAAGAWIWGLHSVEACLECHPESVLELQLEQDAPREIAERVQALGKEAGVKVVSVPRLPKFSEESRPQGVGARLKSFPVESAQGYLRDIETQESGQWVVLDRIQDPRNFGAILRSAAAFGIQGAFFGTREQAPVTSTVAVASAGQLFRLKLLEAPNLAQVCAKFEEWGAHVFTLEMGGQDVEEALAAAPPKAKILWVVGSEGRGVRPGLSAKATQSVSVSMNPGVESLNASVAAAIAFYRGWKKLQTSL